jgi:hypothetical protein
MERRYAGALADLRRQGRCAGYVFLLLPATALPWTDTGLEVAAGTAVTLLAAGHCSTMPGLGRGGGAQFYLWRRISPGGKVAKGARSTTSFECERSGRLELAILHGEWASPAGDLATAPQIYSLAEGALLVTAIAWADGTDAAGGLAALRELVGDDDVLVDAELQRLAHPVRRPDGWS